MLFLEYPPCSTCKKAKQYLLDRALWPAYALKSPYEQKTAGSNVPPAVFMASLRKKTQNQPFLPAT